MSNAHVISSRKIVDEKMKVNFVMAMEIVNVINVNAIMIGMENIVTFVWLVLGNILPEKPN